MNSVVQPLQDLVLIGGGHSHALVLRHFVRRPLAGARITLVSRETHTPYSGMLPGHVAGHYGYDDIHIDLAPLARAAGVRLIVDAAVHIDVHEKRIDFERHTSLRFDVLSLNCGAAPGLPTQSVATPAIPVKPIGGFLPHWRELLDALQQRSVDDRNVRDVIVGGGAGGVELALAVHHALVLVAPSARMVLVTASAQPLDGHAAGVRRRFTALLKARGIDVLTQFVVVDADARGVTGSDGRRVPGELVLW